MAEDFYADENAADAVSEETYNRNLACEDYLKIDIEYKQEPGNWNSGMPQKIYTQVMGGNCDYDMVAMGLNTGIMGGYIDIYRNVLEMEGINPTHDWWVQELVDEASVNGRLIFITGDAGISTYRYLGCIFANLTTASNWGIETDFFQTVRDKKWTMEEFFNTALVVGQDVNNDGAFDPNLDTLGWANIQTGVRLMWSSADVNLINRQDDGTFSVVKELDDRTLGLITKVKDAFDSTNSAYFGSTKDAVTAFVDDRCLFASFVLNMAEQFAAANIESEFAILPLPLYDANQADYISTNISAYNALFFPDNNKDAVLAARVAEFMGYYGQKNIVPKYYDVALKNRYSNNVENLEMLDLIRDKLRVSPNELFGTIGDIVGKTAATNANTGTNSLYATPTSYWKGVVKTFSDGVSEYIFQYFR
jgi:hypothetical protein